MQSLRIALAQINPTVGDLAGNFARMRVFMQKADTVGADILVFPELALTGYPPEDLLLKPHFVQDNVSVMRELAACTDNAVVIAGFVDKNKNRLYNAAAVCYGGKVRGVYHKMKLPNYGVFDEERYFEPGNSAMVFVLGGITFGVSICEDMWGSPEGPISQEARAGARLILNINASPYHAGKIKEREKMVQRQSRDNKVHIAYVNLVGGQDELVFDGQSMIVDDTGRITARGAAFEEDFVVSDIAFSPRRKKKSGKAVVIAGTVPFKNKIWLSNQERAPLEPVAEVYGALVLGLRDYCVKNGFGKVVIGLSGGIDSSLVAALAVDALGKDNVTGVYMPSRYSSQESEHDARALSHNLGIHFFVISIEQLYRMYLVVLEPHFAGAPRNIAEENLQARIRGNVLMALSNKFGWLVLATGNKSEMSTGYATLYGDMAGGLAVIKDVPKTLVYKLARFRNAAAEVIPENVFVKAPTAELKPGQKDSDSLPVYETLDPVLEDYVEEDKNLTQIVAAGFDRETVEKVLHLVDSSEYKRRQSPPGIKITPRAFGRDRRMPITNKYRG